MQYLAVQYLAVLYLAMLYLAMLYLAMLYLAMLYLACAGVGFSFAALPGFALPFQRMAKPDCEITPA